MNYLVDTNVVSELTRGRSATASVTAWFAATAPQQVFTSVIVLGEIRRGIELIARRDKARAAKLEAWYATMRRYLEDRVLPIDEPIMMLWAKISTPDMLPPYDGLIAATALAHDLTVVSRDVATYRRARVEVINPWSA